MEVKSPSDINGLVVRQIRLERKMSLREFWPAVGVSYSAGSAYEHSRNEIPEPVRRVVFLHYVLGLPTDIDAAGFDGLMQADKFKAARDTKNRLAKIEALARKASDHLNQIQEVAHGVH